MPKRQTDKNAYRRHVYSGPKKSLKRVRAGLAQYHNGETSRAAVWRKEEDSSKKQKLTDNVSCNANVTMPDVPKLKTYPSGRKQKIHLEAAYSPAGPSTAEPVIQEPCGIESPQHYPDTESYELSVETVETVPNDSLSKISGLRIVDIRHVIQWAFLLEKHRNMCPSSQIEYVCETQNGFHSNLVFKCSMCDKTWRHSTIKDDKINTSFVWATVTAGSCYTQATHITSHMNIPTMARNKFRHIEKDLGYVWSQHLTEEIMCAGEQERKIAIEKGHVSPDGVPYITVYVAGERLKKANVHNFNASSGMACIIGKETKKCLFLGVRNKYCYTCQNYEKKNLDVKAHTCCKKYSGPSTSIESQIIIESFQSSEEMHKILYLNFIGDIDSSVFKNLKQKVSYGSQIKQNECKNHVIKNYTSALYKILVNTKLPLYGRNILKLKLMKLTQVARKIIMQNSNVSATMVEDLRNGPLHVFGEHENCKDYYCKVKANSAHDIQKDENLVESLKKTVPDVWARIYAANDKIALKAGSLSNETTSVAEKFMGFINKFISGKQHSIGRGVSYQRRVREAGLSHAALYKWHSTAWTKQITQSPGQYLKTYIQLKEKRRLRQQSLTQKQVITPKEKSQPDKDYDPEVCDSVDINKSELRKWCEERLAEFQKPSQYIAAIEKATIGQHDNDLYVTHRCDRLIASQFGKVCKRRNTTPCHNQVEEILYEKNICTQHMLYRQQNKNIARSLFMQQHNKNVRPSGIFIDEEFGFLAASPDGIIEDERAVIEIKYFRSLARKSLSIEKAAREKKMFPLQFENNTLMLNKNHDYYYQVQGQLRVTGMNKCYLICFISVTEPLTVIEVCRDDEFINCMMSKLVNFFKNCVLPEIILRRVPKNCKCIDLT